MVPGLVAVGQVSTQCTVLYDVLVMEMSCFL